MTLVVDASVALKWVLDEEGVERAEAIVGTNPLIAPDFLILECANVLAQNVRRRKLTEEEATAGLARVRASGVRLEPTDAYVDEAQRLVMALGASAYDSLYLALALATPCRLLTADLRFAELVDATHAGVVRRL